MDNLHKEPPIVPFFPFVRIWLCGPLTIEWVDTFSGLPLPTQPAIEQNKDWSVALSLLALLLCRSHRRASRDWILEQFWPESTRSTASHRLETIHSSLCKLLPHQSDGESLLHSIGRKKASGVVYQLDPYPKIWVDRDALLWNVEQAARMERFGDDPLPYWERAFELGKRGPFLMDEPYAEWAQGPRTQVEGAFRQCVHALARLYPQQHGEAGKEEALHLLRSYWLEHKTDEDVLRPLMELLGEQERYQEAEDYYQQLLAILVESDGEKPPLSLDERTRDIYTYLCTKQIQRSERGVSIPDEVVVDSTPAAVEYGAPSSLATTISQEMLLAAKESSQKERVPPSLSNRYQSQPKVFLDILAHKRNIRLALHLHKTSTAQGLLEDVMKDIHDLEDFGHHVKGHDFYNVKELLIANQLLATKIVKDQRHYEHAYTYANNAVRVAKHLEDGELIATTMYTRGCVKFEWAQFGTVQQGLLQLDQKKVREAIVDFQHVLDIAHVQRTPLHPQLQGFTCLQIGRAYSLLFDRQRRTTEIHPLAFVEQTENMISCDSIEDVYSRLVVTGTVSGLHWGAYHLNKAEILIALGMHDQALPELKRLQRLTEQTYARDETRNQAWSNVVMAETLMRMGEYQEATYILRNALATFRSINSLQNTATIVDMRSRLASSSYGSSPDVREIGAMVKEWYGGV